MSEETMSILLVEDDPGDAGLVRHFLERAGLGRFALTRAETLAGMREHLARGAFAAVLLDLTLPDGTGLDTVHAGLAAAPDVPVVILAGRDDDDFALAALDMGVQDYLVKGQLNADSLGRSLRHARARARAEREHARELAEKNRQLDAALSQAQAASQAKTRFLATMSHEVRTPLNAILGFTRILVADPNLSPAQTDQLRTVVRCGEHLHRLLDDVLDMARMESPPPRNLLEDCSLEAMLAELEQFFQPRAWAKGLDLHVHRAPDLPIFGRTDPAKLRRALFNLLDNAIKFTVRGSVTMRLRMLAPDQDGSPVLEAEVQDTGPGITPEDREHLFAPFQQTEAQVRAGGVGLGLALSARFAEVMGGALTLEDTPGRQGCLFRLRLPLPPAQGPVSGPSSGSGPTDAVSGLSSGFSSGFVPSGTDAPPPGIFRLEIADQLRADLLTALEEGDMLRLQNLLETLPPGQEEATGYLRGLADRFEYDRLTELLTETAAPAASS